MPPKTKPSKGLSDTWGRKNRRLDDRECQQCKSIFRPIREASRYCSRSCMWANNGGKNKKPETWWVNNRGYIEGRIWLDEHTQIRVKKHRWIMEQHIGRKLLPDEDVHHKDENKLNNDPSNLEIISHVEHTKHHHIGSKRPAETGKKISEKLKDGYKKHPERRKVARKSAMKGLRKRWDNHHKRKGENHE